MKLRLATSLTTALVLVVLLFVAVGAQVKQPAEWITAKRLVRRMVNPSEGLKHATFAGHVAVVRVRRMVNPSEGLKQHGGTCAGSRRRSEGWSTRARD